MASQAAEVFEKNLGILREEAKWRNKRNTAASGTETCIMQYLHDLIVCMNVTLHNIIIFS